MTLVRSRNTIINLQNIVAISLTEKRIVFELPNNECYTREYVAEREASEAYESLFTDLATAPEVKGIILK